MGVGKGRRKKRRRDGKQEEGRQERRKNKKGGKIRETEEIMLMYGRSQHNIVKKLSFN